MTIWQEWRRPGREVAWAVAAFCVFFVIFQSALLFDVRRSSEVGAKATVVGVGLAYVLASAALSYRVFVHARLTATPAGLTVCNPFRRDQHVTWEEISSMRADRLLQIFAGERRVVVWVVQKNGWDRMKNLRTAADETIAVLEQLAGRALGTGPQRFATRDHVLASTSRA